MLCSLSNTGHAQRGWTPLLLPRGTQPHWHWGKLGKGWLACQAHGKVSEVYAFRIGSRCCWLWRRQWQPTPVLLPGKSHGRRSLVGCSPWGREESDPTEQLHFHFSLSCIGGGNGNPLQCSCLENPRDGGAWWDAICGVVQSGIRLKLKQLLLTD